MQANSTTRGAINTPSAAAVAGIASSVLFMIALVIVRVAVPSGSDDPGVWVTDDGNRTVVIGALNLLPFAGIAFLWFIGVVRDRIGTSEDRFFATVFLGSGLLFVAIVFATGAIAVGLVVAAGEVPTPEVWPFGSHIIYSLLHTYAMRMAAVFIISTTTIVTRLGLVPRWLTVLGLTSGVILMVTAGFIPWIEVIFPAWVLVLSIQILVVSFRASGRWKSNTGHSSPQSPEAYRYKTGSNSSE